MQLSHLIPFALDEEFVQGDHPLIYRPWGTRTIKLKLTTHTDQPALWVRPQGVLPEETALGIHKAYADDSRAFHITWGGGHERGPCAKTKDVLSAFETCAPLAADDTSYLFFNLTHAGTTLPSSASITVRAFECLSSHGVIVERDHARLSLPIKLPPNLPPVDEIIRIVPGEQDGTWITSAGRYLPAYDSRWWPSPEVTYEPGERPPVVVRTAKGALSIEWGEPGKTIAVIEDYTDPSVLLLAESIAFELFAFDQWSFVKSMVLLGGQVYRGRLLCRTSRGAGRRAV